MIDNPLEELLRRQTADGSYDSTSEFTINSLKARQKLSASQLPAPGLWLVKLVQAGVCIHADSMEIVFARLSVHFTLTCREWRWCPRQLVGSLLSGELPSDPFLQHLLTGLRGSLYDDTLTANLAIVDGGKKFEVSFSHRGTEIGESEVKDDGLSRLTFVTSRPRRLPSLRRAVAMPLGHLAQRTADEFLAVYSYCWPCPVPLKVDGRPMVSRYRDSLGLSDNSLGDLTRQFAITSPLQPLPSLLARVAIRGAEGGPPMSISWPREEGAYEYFAWQDREVTLKSQVRLEETWLSADITGEEGSQAYIVVAFGHLMPSRVEFLCDGAVCGFHPLKWRSAETKFLGMTVHKNNLDVGLRVLVAVTPQDLDLSQFGVREPERLLATRFPHLREQIIEVVKLCQERSRDFRFAFGPRPDSGAGRIGSKLISFLSSMHPALKPMVRNWFRSGLETLLESLEADHG